MGRLARMTRLVRDLSTSRFDDAGVLEQLMVTSGQNAIAAVETSFRADQFATRFSAQTEEAAHHCD